MNKIYKKDIESSCEFSLPDYMGDVKKILSVRASVIPSGKFVGDGEVEFSGIVSYDVLYSDSEGRLTHAACSSDYDISEALDPSLYLDSSADITVGSASVRLSGPRKMSLRSNLAAYITVSSESDHEVRGDVFSADRAPQVASESVMSERSIFVSSPEREYAEEADRLEGISADDVEILSTSGNVRITESEAVDGAIRVKGEITIVSIIRISDQPPFAVKRVIPFEESVTAEDSRAGMQSLSTAYLTSVMSGVSETDGGASVTVNAILEFGSQLSSNLSESVAVDAYLTDRDVESKYEEREFTELLSMKNSEHAVSVSCSRAELGLENVRDLLWLSCDIRQNSRRASSGGVVIDAEALISGVACELNDDGTLSYLPLKFTSPITLELDTGCSIPEDAIIECKILCSDTEETLESDKLNVKCRLGIGLRVCARRSVKCLSECTVSGDAVYKASPSVVTVYYPEAGETLFDIAKRYHTTPGKIAEDNALSEETSLAPGSSSSLSGVKRIVIH